MVKFAEHRPAFSCAERLASLLLAEHPEPPGKKKADVAEYLEVFGYVGLLVNGPPGTAGLTFI